MKEIKLTQGKIALVDDEDYQKLRHYTWHFGGKGYAQRCEKYTGKIQMHVDIMKPPEGLQVDHINQNRLDNRRSNLRLASVSQNNCNKPKVGGASQYKGVYKNGKKWQAKIKKDGVSFYLGCYETELEAALVYDAKAKELFGEFAFPNFK